MNLFYGNTRIRILPNNIAKLMSLEFLAYLITDCGAHKNKTGLRLSLYSYNEQEIQILKKAILNLFEPNTIECSIHLYKSQGYALYFKPKSIPFLQDKLLGKMHRLAPPLR
ncbi:MAG: hypothetical protein EOP34_01435 [Rickettsiales bacterium]|nr:MAG: hypothetical protein EOP34_01435 [Rickettsiales bacterium]